MYMPWRPSKGRDYLDVQIVDLKPQKVFTGKRGDNLVVEYTFLTKGRRNLRNKVFTRFYRVYRRRKVYNERGILFVKFFVPGERVTNREIITADEDWPEGEMEMGLMVGSVINNNFYPTSDRPFTVTVRTVTYAGS